MSNWKLRDVPPICERMIGFSVPLNGRILVVSYEGTHTIHLSTEITVEHDDEYIEYDIYDPETGIARYGEHDYSIIGLQGGHPLLRSPQGETLILDADSETLTVNHDGEIVYTLKYENFSGDWAAVTFSPDGQWIALGCPYDFDFVLLERKEAA